MGERDLDSNQYMQELKAEHKELIEDFKTNVAKEFTINTCHSMSQIGVDAVAEYVESERIYLNASQWFVVDIANDYICQICKSGDNEYYKYKYTINAFRLFLIKKLGYDRA